MKALKRLIKRIIRTFRGALHVAGSRRGSPQNDEGDPVAPYMTYIGHLFQSSEARYRFLAENIFDVVWVLDLTFKLHYVSPSYEAMTGFSVDEAMKMNIDDFITPESQEIAKVLLADELKREETGSADPARTIYQDFEFNRKDGTTVWAESRITFLRKAGKPDGLLGVSRDNTARREAEERLRNNEERYRAILENIEDGYYETDLSGRFVFFNGAFSRITRFSPEELEGASYKEIIPTESHDSIYSLFNRVYKEGNPIKMAGSQFAGRDGTVGYIEISVSLRYNADGEKAGFCGIIRDVTEKKKMEMTLKQRAQTWRSLYNSMPGGSFLVDSDRTIVDANPITCTVTGYRFEELAGQDYGMICPEEPCGVTFSLTHAAENKIDNWQSSIRTKEGKTLPVIMSAQRIESPEGYMVLTNFHDISKVKEFEEALRKSEEILRKRNQVIEKDLFTAQLIQKSLLSVNVPSLDWVKVDYRYLPLDAIGGDYFSLTLLREGGLGVFIGDVASHGVTAALYLALVKATSERICRIHALEPARFINMLNKELVGNMPLSFLTADYGLFSFTEGQACFTFSSAGHPHPILWRADTGGADFLYCKGTLIGMFTDLEYKEESVALGKGDRIFLYTDGIPETVNDRNEIIGFDELPSLIQKNFDRSLEKTLDNIIEAVNLFRGRSPLSDDIIIIGFEVV